jgi:hypothetical protein
MKVGLTRSPPEELKQHQESLEIYFREHPQKTLAHAAATIAELTENCP